MADIKAMVRTYWPLAVLGAITIFAACIRVAILRESFWIDELHTAWTIDGTFAEVFSRAKMGNQGPVYFVALWFWKHVAGMSEIALRLPSWFAGVALPAAVYGCVRKFDREEGSQCLVALFAAVLAATDPNAIFYSQEARPYAWVMLGSVLHFTAFALWLRKPSRAQTIGVIVGAAALFFLHYTTALLFVAEAMYAALVISSQSRATSEVNFFQVSLRQLLILPIILAILCLPALPTLQLLVERKQNWEAFVTSPIGADLLHLFPGALAIIFVAIGYLPGGPSRRMQSNDRPAILPLAMRVEVWAAIWLFVPLCVTWLSTYWKVAVLFYPRYLVAALPASWILMGQSIRATEYKVLQFVIAGLLLFMWCDQREVKNSIRGVYSREENWREAVAFINQHYAETPGIVYVDAGLIEKRDLPRTEGPSLEALQEYLLLPVRGPYRLQAEDVRPISDPTFAFSPDDSEYVWIIYRRSGDIDEEIMRRLVFPRTNPAYVHYERFGNVFVVCMPSKMPSPQ